MTIFFFVLSAITVILSVLSHFALSKGKLNFVYPLNIIIYSLYIIIETSLAFNSPEQIGIILFLFTNTWALVMAISGLKRLRSA